MNNNDYGMTDSGYRSLSYEEILEKMEDEFMAKYGSNISLAGNSNIGMLVRSLSLLVTHASQSLQQVFYSSFVSTADGIALDRLGSNFGLTRKVATHSVAKIEIRTEEEYLIQAGEQFETEDGIIFTLLSDVVTVKDPNPPVPPTAKDDTSSNDDTSETDDNDDSDDDNGDNDDDQTPIGTFVGIGTVQSDETGSMNNVPANSITIVSNPDDNIDSVTNLEKAGGGQDDETDETFRNRIIMENVAKPGSTENGVNSALRNLPGVRRVGFVYNKTSETDKDGNPPYSTHIYISGGDGQEIANTLYNTVAAGTILTGDQIYDVPDVNGSTTKIAFSFAHDLNILVDIKIQTNDQWNSDSDNEELKEAIIQNISELNMGETVHSTKLYSVVYSFNGIDNAEVTIGTATDNIGKNIDVVPNRFEVPVCSTDNITISNFGA